MARHACIHDQISLNFLCIGLLPVAVARSFCDGVTLQSCCDVADVITPLLRDRPSGCVGTVASLTTTNAKSQDQTSLSCKRCWAEFAMHPCLVRLRYFPYRGLPGKLFRTEIC